MKELIDSSIESLIIKELIKGPLTSVSIVEKINRLRPNTPKQSVYLSLRKLKEKEVIAVSGKMVSLHEVWLTKMRNFFSKATKEENSSVGIDLRSLEEKEKITYTFNSLLSLDRFWAHAFLLLSEDMKKEDSILLYNPHQWFLLVRKESELSIIKELEKRHIYWLQLVGANTKLDKEIRENFDGVYSKCHFLEDPIFPKNYYVNVFNDFLIEVWIDENMAEEIGKTYTNNEILDKNILENLKKLINDKKYKHKMRISRNKKKSDGYLKTFKKYFIIK